MDMGKMYNVIISRWLTLRVKCYTLVAVRRNDIICVLL